MSFRKEVNELRFSSSFAQLKISDNKTSLIIQTVLYQLKIVVILSDSVLVQNEIAKIFGAYTFSKSFFG